jgi:16S rRNA (adenine1518-N6/adenine1519-N6)-dimethyltransferase
MSEIETQTLYSPRVVRELLTRHGLRPTKSLGQNFLIDGNILRFMVEAGGATPGANVYEVGPGLGVLTKALSETGASVISIEKDERLQPVLEETLAGLSNVRVVFKDALEFPWHHAPEGSILVANLPYYISTAIISKILESGRFASLTFLVQREVALRLDAKVNSDGYGFLSALVALYGTAKRLRDVPKGAFFPEPDITSSIARITVVPGKKPAHGVVKILEAVLHHRRKTLRNNLKLAGYDDDQIRVAVQHANLEPEIRGEAIPLEKLALLAEILEKSEA